jgi:hypothetical protein
MKWFNEIKDKLIVALLSAIVLGALAWTWNFIESYAGLPNQIRVLEFKGRQDSIKLARIDSICSAHKTFIEQDWRVLNAYARELGLPEPKEY